MTASPCIGVCQLDGRTQTCVGCGRTIAEIAAWADLDENERRAIIARLRTSQPPQPEGYDG
ncbi:MAG TPA: DUF1289 domain-containing protein [Alphaproteobacteria bacterium]|nr:DUF1289 domain-containing protein [Alphaproteobacteria bacterium]